MQIFNRTSETLNAPLQTYPLKNVIIQCSQIKTDGLS